MRYHHRLSLPRFIAEPFFEPHSETLRFLPEGPRVFQNYPGGAATLGWVAIQHAVDNERGSINLLDLASRQNRSFALPGRPGFFVETRRPGVLLVGLERRLIYFDLLTGQVEESGVEVPGADERVIINDGLAVDGGVIFGTKHLAFNQPIAGLYYFDAATRRIHTLRGDQTCSNGKFLRRRGGEVTLIDIDSTPKAINRYTLDGGLTKILAHSTVVAPEALPAFPDGLRPVPDGESVVVAFFNPEPVVDGLARQFRLADGAVLCEWSIPGSPRVTCPEFVELDGKVKLLFTTAVEGMSVEARRLAPGAGTMYIADTPFDRLPTAPPPL